MVAALLRVQLCSFMFVKICVENVQVNILFVFCPQETIFAFEEESVMSGKGRCPYDPNSSCMSTLSSKITNSIPLIMSASTELKSKAFSFQPTFQQICLPSYCNSIYCHLVVTNLTLFFPYGKSQQIFVFFFFLLGGELYIGLYTDYWENDGALCRLNNHTYTRTERNDRQQLNGWLTKKRKL